MYAPSKTVRLVSAAMAAFVGATLVMAKVHFSDEYVRLTAHSDLILPHVAKAVGEQPTTNLASTPNVQRAN